MLMCVDCKSTNIIETDDFQAYFQEGEWIRLRTITVYKNQNRSDYENFIAYCKELSLTATATGDTHLQAILNLAKILEGMYGVRLIGKQITEDE